MHLFLLLASEVAMPYYMFENFPMLQTLALAISKYLSG